MKSILLYFFLFCSGLAATAQSVTNYSFTATSGTFTAIAGTAPGLSAGTVDDGAINAIPIGFDFWYMGERYTTISASTNGWLSFGGPINSTGNYSVTNNLTSGGLPRPVLAPLWDDLALTAANTVTYTTTGTAGNMIFTVQYLNVKWDYIAMAAGISFQVKLYEATGKIEYIYRQEAGAANAPSASIGITATGTGSGNFLSVNTSAGISSTTETSTFNGKPPTGRIYTFTPPKPNAPTNLTYSAVTASSTNLNWTDNSGNETGFVVYRSTDGVNFNFVTQTAANATSVNIGSLSTGLQYWRVYAVSEGGLSNVLAGTQSLCGSTTPYALAFDGVNDYVGLSNTLTASFTLESWIKTSATSLTGADAWLGNGLIWADVAGNGNDFILSILNNKLIFYDGNANASTVGSLNINDGAWHHIAVVRTAGSPGTVRLYVDGVQDGATGVAGAAVLNANPNIALGGNTLDGRYYNGYMDEVRLWNVARTAAEIANNRFANLSGSETGLNRYFRLNEGSGATARSSSSGTDGTLTNMNTAAATAPTATSGWVTAGFSYAAGTYCTSGGTANISANGSATAGTFTASPAGLSINSATGAVTLASSNPGTYTVTRTTTTNGCNIISTATITITAASTATISYGSGPYCTNLSSGTVTRTGTAGGVYSSTAGLSINTSTGAINPSASTPGTYTVTYTIAASGSCPLFSTTTQVVIAPTPAAPVVTTPVVYCLDAAATALTATGSNLVWGGSSANGTVGGTATLINATYVDGASVNNNKRTLFSTSGSTVRIASVDYYIPAYQNATNLVLAIFDNSGNIIATSSTTTSLTSGATPTKVTAVFDYLLPAAGNYSIGVSSGSGNIGSDSPTFPITEPGGVVSITGVSVAGARCFNNLQFLAGTGAPVPSTAVAGTFNYTVTQTVNGCVSPAATIEVIVNAPASATISYSPSYCKNIASAQPVTRTGTAGGTYSSTAGLTINATTGAITPSTSTAGNYVVTYSISPAGCAPFSTTANVTITPVMSPPVFTAGSSSVRCPGAAVITYGATATNSTSVSYALDATSLGAGNTINTTTGEVTYTAGYNGTSTITATASGCGGPLVATHTVTMGTVPVVSGSATETCIGGSTGVITASGSGGTLPYTFNLNGGAYQSSNIFSGLAAGSYTIGIRSAAGCTSTVVIVVNTPAVSADDQLAAGADSWIGHIYDGISFNTYYGQYTEPLHFDQSFGGNTSCFSLSSAGAPRTIYTETFSVRYRMNSTLRGLYVADLGGDDGTRLIVDGVTVYNNFNAQSFGSRPRVLMNLTGASNLLYEYFEQGGSNRVVYQNSTLVLENTLSVNTDQQICQGNAGAMISGDAFGTLPAGITLSGTGYQWYYSTTPEGTKILINGATAATYTPSAAAAPFNTPGVYYLFRYASVSSTNNVSPNPYVATNVSAAAVITVQAAPSATISYAGTPYCSNAGTASVVLSGTTGGTFTAPAGLSINASTGNISLGASTPGTYTVTYTIAANGSCPAFTTTTQVTITRAPMATGSYAGSPYCVNGGTVSPTGSSNSTGTFSSTPGITLNSLTGTITLGTSTPGNYTITYTIPASGGCAAFVYTTNVTITAAPSATISYSGSPFCSDQGIATVTHSGTTGGTYSAPAGLSINPATGAVSLAESTPGTYTVTYTVPAASGCAVYTTTTSITVTAAPFISQVPVSDIIAFYPFNGNAADASHTNDGALMNGPSAIADRFGNANSAYVFNGASQYVRTTTIYHNPATFTISAWFNTTTNSGGKLIGFGNAQTGTSGGYDRHLYMSNSGQVYFGVYPGSVKTIHSPAAYNDGKWHQATATLSGSGMILFIDGVQVAIDATVTSAEPTSGWWKIGYDNLNGWTSAPTSHYFNGIIDDVTIHHRALTAQEVSDIFIKPGGASNNGPVCSGGTIQLSATSVPGASYSWTGPNGFSSSQQNPTLVFTPAAAGVYTLTVSIDNCSTKAYTIVEGTTSSGLWTGLQSTDWNTPGNWCTGVVPTSSVDVLIPADAVRMPVVSSNSYARNLTIETGASVTTAAAGDLHIAGTITNNGTMTNAGTTTFDGTSGQQSFTGVATFADIVVDNTAGVILSSAITTRNVTLATGTLTLNNFGVTVTGNFTNNASASSLIAGTAAVTFSGSASQEIGGAYQTTFRDIYISNTAATVTLTQDIHIDGLIVVSTGAIFDLDAFRADRTTAGGTLYVGNNARLKIGGTNTFPANFNTHTLLVASTVEYAGTNQAVLNTTYGNLVLSSSSGAIVKTFPASPFTVTGNLSSLVGAGTSVTYTAGSNISINGNVSIGAATTFNGGTGVISIGGNVSNAGTFNGNSGSMVIGGTGATITGNGVYNANDLTITGALVSIAANTVMSASGNVVTTGSGSFTHAAGGNFILTGTGKQVSGLGMTFASMSVPGTLTTSSSFTVTGDLQVAGSFNASAGSVIMSGTNKTISGSGVKSFFVLSAQGTITTSVDFTIKSALNVIGSITATAGTATFTSASTLSGTANLYNADINGTSFQLTANAVLGIAKDFTQTAGSFNVTSSTPNTVNFNGTSAQTVNGLTYDRLIISGNSVKTAAGAITVNNDFTIGATATFESGSYTHNFYKDWYNNGTFVANTGTIRFVGGETSNIYGATTFNQVTVDHSAAAVSVVLQSNVSVSTVNMLQGTVLTGSNTLTITTTRTGPGIILGNIQRTHAFTTGISYAFESPENTVNFTSVTGVSSITVSVSLGNIADFPNGAAISRLYNISVPAGSYSGTLRLHYEDNELNGNDEAIMALWKYNGSVWSPFGKTLNNATSNYVEFTGLTDITNRWTLSDNSNVVQWSGAVSTEWNNPDNWTVTEGSASRPPGPSDVVGLGIYPFNHQPQISTAVSIKNLSFGSNQQVTLSMAAGGSLTTAGAVAGEWSVARVHVINVNDQSITIGGDMVLGTVNAGEAIDININNGAVNVTGQLEQRGGAAITFTGTGDLRLGDKFIRSNGNFTAGNGTVTFNGAANQSIPSLTYNNLVIDKTAGSAEISHGATISGNLDIPNGDMDNLGTTRVAGNVTVAATGILHNMGTLHVGGNWTNAGTFTDQGLRVIFDGAGAQSISASVFNNLEIDKPSGVATLTGDLAVNGDIHLMAGTLDLATFLCNRPVSGGFAHIDGTATLIIGANNAPQGFASYIISPTSTAIFNGVDMQTLFLPDDLAFGHLVLSNTGEKVLMSNMTINGNLTLTTGAVLTAGEHTVTLNGNWNNNGGTLQAGTGTFIMNGPSQTINGNTSFNKVVISGAYNVTADIQYFGLLNITPSGAITSGPGIVSTLHSDLINSGILITSGHTIFSGNQQQTMSLLNGTTFALTVSFNGSVPPLLNSTSVPQFGYLNINNTGGVNPSVNWTIAYALNIGAGASFNGGNYTHTLLGSLNNAGTITSSGIFNFLPASATTLNLGTNFSSTGTVVFGGEGAIALQGTPLALRNVNISNTNIAGVTPSSNWVLSRNLTVQSSSVLNAGSYTYSIGGNLVNNGGINRGTSTFKFDGNQPQTITNNSPLHNLTIDKPAGALTLLSNTTVYGALNFTKGNIATGAQVLALAPGATTTGAAQATGWVVGNFQKHAATGSNVSVAYEIGDSISYSPVNTIYGTVTTAGNPIASLVAMDHPNLNTSPISNVNSVNKYYRLLPNGVQFNTAVLGFNWVAEDLDANATPLDFEVARYTSSWSLMPATGATTTSIMATGVTAFGEFAIGSTSVKWTGDVSTDWFTAGNWSPSIPSEQTNIVIPASRPNYPVLTSTAAVKNVQVSSGATLTITEGLLRVHGSISGSNNINAANGTVDFAGTAAQVIPANIFTENILRSLTVTNNSGVTMTGALSVSDVLTIAAGQLNTGDSLRLTSTATGTARVAPVTSNAITPINGQVTVERYIPGRRKYRLITSSVTTHMGSTLVPGQEALSIWGNWQNQGNNVTPNVGNFITGGTSADGFDTQTGTASLFTYDDVNRRFTGYTSANGKNTKYTPLKAGIAYYMFVYGDRRNTVSTSSPNNTVLAATGTLLTGTQQYTSSSSQPLSPVAGRWTMLGNPYASPIDWAMIERSDVANTYWGWDPNVSSTGGYVTITSTGSVTLQAPYSGATGLNQYIQPGQGFFVRTTGANPVMTIREQHKVGEFNSMAFRGQGTANNVPLIAVNLLYVTGGNTVLADGVVSAFDSQFANAVGAEDALKMANSAESVSIINGTESLSIDARRLPVNNDTLKLKMDRLTRSQYTLQIFAGQLVGKNIQPYIVDRHLNTTVPLSITDTNRIVFSVISATPSTYDVNRFSIVYRTLGIVLPVKFTAIRATALEKDVKVDWSVAEEESIDRYEIEHSTDGINFTKRGEVTSVINNGAHTYTWTDVNAVAGNNHYRIKAIETTGGNFYSNQAMARISSSENTVSVYPNPVRNRQFNLAVNGGPATYTLRLYDISGRLVMSSTVDHSGGRATHPVSLPGNLVAGAYHLKLTGGKVDFTEKLFVQ